MSHLSLNDDVQITGQSDRCLHRLHSRHERGKTILKRTNKRQPDTQSSLSLFLSWLRAHGLVSRITHHFQGDAWEKSQQGYVSVQLGVGTALSPTRWLEHQRPINYVKEGTHAVDRRSDTFYARCDKETKLIHSQHCHQISRTLYCITVLNRITFFTGDNV